MTTSHIPVFSQIDRATAEVRGLVTVDQDRPRSPHRIASFYDRSCYRPGAPRTERDPDLDLYRSQMLGTLGMYLLTAITVLVAACLWSR